MGSYAALENDFFGILFEAKGRARLYDHFFAFLFVSVRLLMLLMNFGVDQLGDDVTIRNSWRVCMHLFWQEFRRRFPTPSSLDDIPSNRPLGI